MLPTSPASATTSGDDNSWAQHYYTTSGTPASHRGSALPPQRGRGGPGSWQARERRIRRATPSLARPPPRHRRGRHHLALQPTPAALHPPGGARDRPREYAVSSSAAAGSRRAGPVTSTGCADLATSTTRYSGGWTSLVPSQTAALLERPRGTEASTERGPARRSMLNPRRPGGLVRPRRVTLKAGWAQGFEGSLDVHRTGGDYSPTRSTPSPGCRDEPGSAASATDARAYLNMRPSSSDAGSAPQPSYDR